MNYLFGVLTGVVLFILLLSVLYIGYRLGNKKKPPVKTSKEEVQKADRLRTDFMKLMNYDVTTALQRKKV